MNNLLKYLSQEEYQTIEKEKNLYNKALSLVTILFQEKYDKEGEPYLNHLIRVSEQIDNSNTKVAALLHDTVEDIKYINYQDLLNIGFPEEIIAIVKIVTTEDKEKSYHDKITSIIDSNNIEAIKLKYADMSDNANPERMKVLDQELQDRLHKKYDNELKRLKEKIERSS